MHPSASVLQRVVTVILGGGRGTRLYPLTERRAKPAVSFGGKYRLIDIPISNSINSGIRKIFVLTQFLSAGLHSHITRTYRMDGFSQGFVEILAAEQTPTRKTWFQGTADAVRHGLRYSARTPHDHVLILSGDQLYRMDFADMLRTHLDSRADVTLAATLVGEENVPRMGILRIDADGRVVGFVEKPESPETRETLAVPEMVRGRLAARPGEKRHLASMGIFLFRRQALYDLLADGKRQDLPREVIPAAFERLKVVFHPFDGYWEDVGTLRTFFEANLDLAGPMPRFDLYDPVNPLFSRYRNLPAAKIQNTHLDRALVAEGAIIEGASLSRVVVGLRSVIRPGATIRNSVLIGNDFYESEEDGGPRRPEIGRNTLIETAVIDKNAVIGEGCVIRDKTGAPDSDHPLYTVRDGITVIRDGTVLPPGTMI
ncbi:MAG: NTP transferase domain-containing protein [Candidatus Eisenbacteria bacterium]|nr:NTP transferase domain-containing protein [Candidatus Eisenbacteria bacterium]